MAQTLEQLMEQVGITKRTEYGRKIFLRGLEAIQNADPAKLAQQVGARGSAANKVAQLVALAKKQAGRANEGEQTKLRTAHKVRVAAHDPTGLVTMLGLAGKVPDIIKCSNPQCNFDLTTFAQQEGLNVDDFVYCPGCERKFVEQEVTYCYASGHKIMSNGKCPACRANPSDSNDQKVAVIAARLENPRLLGNEALKVGMRMVRNARESDLEQELFEEICGDAERGNWVTQVENGTHPTLRPVRESQQPKHGQPGNDPFDYRRGFGQ